MILTLLNSYKKWLTNKKEYYHPKCVSNFSMKRETIVNNSL